MTKTDLPGQPHHPKRIFHYYCFHLRQIAQPAFILDITDHWEKKREAIACYHSQFVEGRSQEPPDFFERLHARATTWGLAIGTRFGEPFACREPVGIGSLRGLV